MNEIVCSVDGCERTVKSKGLCTTHYHRMYRHGRTDKPKTKREALIETGFSYCPKCNKEKEISEFNKDKHTAFGVAIYCRKCTAEKSNLRYVNFKRNHRNTQLKSNYNITIDEYEKLLIQQNNGCAICGRDNNGKRMMCVDHCHSTGGVRGLLCNNCNLGLGNFMDDIKLLENAIKYLK